MRFFTFFTITLLAACSADIDETRSFHEHTSPDAGTEALLFVGCAGLYHEKEAEPISIVCLTPENQHPRIHLPQNVTEPLFVKLIDASIKDWLVEEAGEPYCIYHGSHPESFKGCTVEKISPSIVMPQEEQEVFISLQLSEIVYVTITQKEYDELLQEE